MDVAKVEATIKNDFTWLQKHEKLVLAVIAGLVLWFSIGKIDTLIANHDNATLHQAQVVADQQAAVNQGLAQQAAYQAAQYKELATKLDSQNQALVAANTQLATSLAQHQKADASLPPSGLAERWHQLVPQVTTSDVSAGQMTVNTPGVSATVQQLEVVPVLRTQFENERTQYENAQKLLALSNNETTTLISEVTGLRTQIVDDTKVCTAQIAVVKAEALRSKRRWFIVGYVAGFLSRQYIKTATGL